MDGRRYLALWFPWLPCERARRQSGLHDDPRPFALVARSGNALRLTAVAPGAGLAPGMALADARARYPDLLTQPHDRQADARDLARLATRLLRVTPMVAHDPPDGLVLDLTGVAHLFGGEDGTVAAALARCAGLTVRHALADHADSARALARHGGQDVRALPVIALGLDAAATAALRRAGLKTIGDLAVRPMAGLAARFGPGAVTALRRLLGEARAPIDPLVPVAALRFERRFAEPIGHQAAVMAAIGAMLDEARGVLEARALGGRRFRLSLWRSDGQCRHLEIQTSRPMRDPAPILRLFEERIAELDDPLDPGFGYDAIALAPLVTEPLAASQPGLDGGDHGAQDSLTALIDRLTTRLGPDSVLCLVAQDSHVPERAQAVLPLAKALNASHCERPTSQPVLSTDRPPRPLVLFDPPQPVEVIAGVPDGPPLRFRWRDDLHSVRLAEGPERIAPEWWRQDQGHWPDAAEPTRDYYRVEDEAGTRFWIFRHGLYDEPHTPRWYLHGLFA